MKKFVTCKEAAELLGVSIQSIRNYAERGLLTERREPRRFLYPRVQVDALAGYAGEIENLDAKLCSLVAENEQLYREAKELNDRYRAQRNEAYGGAQAMLRYRKLVHALVDVLSKDVLNDREAAVLRYVTDGMSKEQIGEKIGAGMETVRNSFVVSLRKLYRFQIKYSQMETMIRDYRITLRALQVRNGELERQLRYSRDHFGLTEERPPVSEPLVNDVAIYDIRDIMSTRTYNILVRNDIRTLGQLSLLRLDYVKHFHGCGAGSIKEMERILNDYGLGFAQKPSGFVFSSKKDKDYESL